MTEAIINLTILLTVTTAIVLLLNLFRQPPIIGYIFAGILLGPSLLDVTNNVPGLEVFGHIGIAFLLFILGLNLDVRSLKQVGVVSVATGLGQIIFTSAIGYLVALTFGFSHTAAIYIAVALTFSSTIIIVKLLTDKKELDTLHGKVAMGFLIVQDIVAVLVLMFISSFAASEQAIAATIGLTVFSAAIIFVLAALASKYLLPYLLRYAGKNQEILFLFSITWCFALAATFDLINFSLEIGALLAGLMLASTPYSYEIASKIKPLRDFFIIIFFIVLGAQLELTLLGAYLLPAIILSLFVIIGNPLIVMTIMGLQGFSKRTSFKAGLTVGQISEFGLIIVALGLSVGHVDNAILNLVTMMGLTTILISTYLILYADPIYDRIKHLIPYKRRGVHKHENQHEHLLNNYDVILFGYNRMGYNIAEHFIDKEKHLLIIDFNPEVVLELQERGINAILGDANDAELYEEIRLDHPEVIISTITDLNVNNLLLTKTRLEKATVLVTGRNPDDALHLYEQGADYVIIPHLSGGEHAAVMLDVLNDDLEEFINRKEAHVQQLKKRRKRS